jgi:hypothetical protein
MLETVVNTLKKPFSQFLEQSGSDMVRSNARNQALGRE